ncbi:MAG: type I DNA topoisomerase [Lentisphaeria bacterium]|nr:type I DNA topoisomerase [Lentisphaeria bacterium]
MSKNLVIVESPQKAKTITKILGKDYKVMASMGHIRDLPESGLGVDVEKNFAPKYKVSAGKKKVIDDLVKETKDAENIFLAPDPDREGEAIAWHLYEVLRKKVKDANFQRVTFHEITKPAVQHSFDHPSEIDMNRVNAQQARRVLDRLVGYQVSPLLWRKVKRGRSAGRVQTVALRMICEREKEIMDFVPEEYWNLAGIFNFNNEIFSAKLAKIAGDNVKISSQTVAEDTVEDIKQGAYAVSSVKTVPRKRNPKPPFVTSTLQQAASSNLRMSPSQTMRIAQQLYEGADGAVGEAGLITYMRTDSVNVSEVAQNAARDFITSQYGADYYPPKPNRYKSKGAAQEAHEAIRPTDVTFTPAMAKSKLDDQQARLYTLIWNRFMASQMAPARLSQHTVEIENSSGSTKQDYLFRVTSTKTVFPGYMRVYNLEDAAEDKTEEEENKIPDLKERDGLDLTDVTADQKFTEPPYRFSEATLIRELDKFGVGRPSTYATIVNTIQQREYVSKDKGKLVPSNLGFSVYQYLVDNIPNLFEINFTAQMEEKLDDVEDGKLDWEEMMTRFYEKFHLWVEEAQTKTNVPEESIVRGVWESLNKTDIPWSEPEKVGRKTYDDSKFYHSLLEQMDEGKPLSDNQWTALLALVVKYREKVDNLDGLIEKYELKDTIQPILAKAQEEENYEPDDTAVTLCALMEQVQEWEVPADKKARNDKEFYESIKRQAMKKPLTERQIGALKTILQKYSDQIPQYKDVQEEYGLLPLMDSDAKSKLAEMVKMLGEITKWAEPTKRGRRTYSDESFAESLSSQFQSKGILSDKQTAAMAKIINKYPDQIENFEERKAGNSLLTVVEAEKTKPVETGITCPECNKSQIVERKARRGGSVFYGCSAYPKCKYTAKSLEEVKAKVAEANS